MNHYKFKCTASTTFSDEDVIQWLIETYGLGVRDETDASTYQPTFDDALRYAWHRFETGDGECECDLPELCAQWE